MARKPKKEEHVNHERWLVSYADFMTLLFAFFTALYAMSTVDAKKAARMSLATRAAFNVDMFPTDKPMSQLQAPMQEQEPDPVSRRDKRHKPPHVIPLHNLTMPRHQAARLSRAGAVAALKKMQQLIEHRKLFEAGVTASIVNNNLVLQLKDKAFFDKGGAHLRAESLPTLNALAEALLPLHAPIRIEGHTDDDPPHGKTFSSNWDLSSERAVTVVEYFAEEFGYPPDAMAVAGYGSANPLGDNKTAEGRAKNRRVDLVLLGEP